MTGIHPRAGMPDPALALQRLERPWRMLAEYVRDFTVAEVAYFGSGYLGDRTYPGAIARRASIATPLCA